MHELLAELIRVFAHLSRVGILLLSPAILRGEADSEATSPAKINAPFASDISRLKTDKVGAPIHVEFLLWDEQIVTAKSTTGEISYYSFTADDLQPKKLSLPGMDQLLSLGEFRGVPIALGRVKAGIVLMQKDKAGWTQIAAPPEWQNITNGALIRSHECIAVLSGSNLFRLVDNKWTGPIHLPPVPKFYREFTPNIIGTIGCIYHSQLFLGWDRGEWGGMLAAIDLREPLNGWREVSGKNRATSSGIVGNDPVAGMDVDLADHLWVGTGSGYPEMSRGFYEYDGKTWKVIVRGEFKKSEGGLMSFPGESADVNDVVVAPDDRPYILSGQLGIFAYQNEKLQHVLPFAFYDISKHEESDSEGKKIALSISCYPGRLVVDRRGDLFVSTTAFGILCFLKQDSGFKLHQILLR